MAKQKNWSMSCPCGDYVSYCCCVIGFGCVLGLFLLFVDVCLKGRL